ncbi:DUF6308 family protein [Actinoplanes sp. NPDC049599]|uniref:DUF6308 family protein n=1 Tax=Actinoplanes sp. NPDC049599 TaxID=3363903 RepID=UPI0037A14999
MTTGPAVRVGGKAVSLARAERWVDTYFDGPANRTADKPFAYPAYDELCTGSGPDQLNDGDLLAPTMLNAAPTIAAFYSLQAARPRLEQGLRAVPGGLSLQASAADGSLRERLGNLAGVLDGKGLRGVRLTMLSKVLHRKRPSFVPLYDQFVRACYVGERGRFPIQVDRARSWAGFAGELGEWVARDLADQDDVWRHLAARVAGEVTTLRVLDVVAWNLGRPDA